MALGFEVSSDFVFFTGNEPGSFVTMFDPSGKLLKYRDDVAVFQPDHFLYKWAFEYNSQRGDGKRFVFATSEKSVVGKMKGSNEIAIVEADVEVERDSEGKPLRLKKSIPLFSELKPLKRRLEAFNPTDTDLISRPRIHVSMPSPRVSIITCSHNRPQMLLECISSVRAQTDESWEHLICDDGSTDNAVKEVLERAAALDSRVRVYRKTPNINQPARYWNELLDRARGDYFAFLDDDNLKYPEFIATLSAVLDDAPEVDMVTCGWTVIDKSDGITECHLNMKTSLEEIERRSTIDTGAFLIRREAMERIGYFPLNICTNEDWAMMRRAVECLEMVHLPDTLATYRSHDGQRMEVCEDLGNERDKNTVQSSVWGASYGVRVHHAPLERLAASQRDVVDGIKGSLDTVSWLEDGSDLAIVLMPFQMDMDEVEMIAASHRSIVSVHSEDPFALNANLDRVRAMAALCQDVWVCSNDTTCLDEYRALVGNKVTVCPSLSIHEAAVPSNAKRLVDALLVGYAYPGRVRFVTELLKHFDPKRLKIVGDGWKEAGFKQAWPTMPATETAALYSKARAVICLHRGHGDCVDGPYEPRLVQRGYVEGMGGARVFVDTSRPDHALDEGEVEWFGTAHDLFTKLQRFLSLSDEKQKLFAEPLKERALRDFTYRTRMTRIINAVRSTRYGAVIP